MQEKLTIEQVSKVIAEELTQAVNEFGLMDCELRMIINHGLQLWSFQRLCIQTEASRQNNNQQVRV